ncbi:plasmid stabilization protein [Aquella oligotrophica]|uniref:Plasmid stabilization protein n=1 Tax=Aquella oligotrophica TaxID=2067065 RepID=A0A2I7N3A1_9NEIS|nr:plasmid stabilization protein [Aquella oligotrophica]
MDNPIVPKDRLHGTDSKECYKTKLRSQGIRLVYAVERDLVTLVVIGVGKRENDDVYNELQ